MIVGIVKRRELLIPLTIHRRGRTLETDVVVDTGFTGWLMLPPSIVESLGLRWYNSGSAELADGSIVHHDVYLAKIVWHGRVRQVRVNELDGAPLIGMSLLRGFELNAKVRSRGKVTIKRLPA